MTLIPSVAHGTAENLALIAHHATAIPDLEQIAWQLLGDVGDGHTTRRLWSSLRDDCEHLWRLHFGAYSEHDLDELTDDEWQRYSFATGQQEQEERRDLTVTRLTWDIEHAIHLARHAAVEAHRRPVTV